MRSDPDCDPAWFSAWFSACFSICAPGFARGLDLRSGCQAPGETTAVSVGAASIRRSGWQSGAVLLLLSTLLTLMASPASAQWAWRDKNGRVNASDRPPPREVPDKDILSRPAAAPTAVTRNAAAAAEPASATLAATAPAATAASSASAAAASPLQREVEARRLKTEQDQAAKTKADEARAAAVRADNCQRARGAQAAIESGQRMSRTNEKGEREVLDDRGRAEELRQARAVVASDCR